MDCGDIDGIIVTSGSSGERIKWLIDRLDDVLVYSIGPACSKKLIEAGIVKERIVEAEKHTYDGLVEAVYMPEKAYVWAVQWHPELFFQTDVCSRKIFKSFVAACK